MNTPQREQVAPARIATVVEQLLARDDQVARDAAAIITSLIAASPVVVGDMTVCIDTNTAQRGDVSVKLPPNHAVLAKRLAERFPANVAVAEMCRDLWGEGGATDARVNTLRVQLSHLRARLRPLKILIQAQPGPAYRLVQQ